MFTVIVQEKGGKTQRLQFNKSEITVGRVQGNDIVLPKGNVSKRHSKIVFKEGKFIVVDLKSTNGTYVNGHKIASPQVIKSTDKVFIGDFVLEIEEGAGAGAAPGMEAPPPMPPGPPGTGTMPPRPAGPGPMAAGPGPGPMPPGPGPGPGPMPPGPGMQPRPGGPGGPMPPAPPGGGPGAAPMAGPRPQQPPAMPGAPGMTGAAPGLPAGGPRPAMAGGRGSWQEVSVGGGPTYYYLGIQGGWLVMAQNSMVFISDPGHQNPPNPA